VTQTLATGASAGQRQGAAIVLGMLCGGKTKRQQEFAQAAQAHSVFDLKIDKPDERPLGVLIERLAHDPVELVRESCAQALGNIGSERAALPLAQAVGSDPSPNVRATAAQALELIPGRAALPALAKAVVSDRAPRVRQFAVTALGWMHDPATARPLIQATQDKDAEVRRLAAVQLGRMGTPEALGSLVELIADPNEDVRWAAVLAVDSLPTKAKLADPHTTDALVRAVADHSMLVSQAAQTALQHLGDTRRPDAYFKQGPGRPSA
jgi:HEAT repeat protein